MRGGFLMLHQSLGWLEMNINAFGPINMKHINKMDACGMWMRFDDTIKSYLALSCMKSHHHLISHVISFRRHLRKTTHLNESSTTKNARQKVKNKNKIYIKARHFYQFHYHLSSKKVNMLKMRPSKYLVRTCLLKRQSIIITRKNLYAHRYIIHTLC